MKLKGNHVCKMISLKPGTVQVPPPALAEDHGIRAPGYRHWELKEPLS